MWGTLIGVSAMPEAKFGGDVVRQATWKKLLKRLIVLLGVMLAVVVVAYAAGVQVVLYLRDRGVQKLREEGVARTQQILDRMGTLRVGDTLPDFTLEDYQGKEHRLSDLVSNRTLISYAMPDCDACLGELEVMKRAVKDSADFRYFLVISDANPAHFEAVRQNMGVNCRFLFDNGGAFRTAFGIFSYPFNMIVAKDLTVLEIRVGYTVESDFEEVVKANHE